MITNTNAFGKNKYIYMKCMCVYICMNTGRQAFNAPFLKHIMHHFKLTKHFINVKTKIKIKAFIKYQITFWLNQVNICTNQNKHNKIKIQQYNLQPLILAP